MKYALVLLCSLTGFLSFAQPYSWMGKPKPYKIMVGAGLAAIDDDGRPFCQPFDVNQSWNYLPYPTRIVVDTYLKKGMSLDFSGTYMQYSASKLINGSVGKSGLFIAVDASLKYSFYDLIGTNWFDPYVSLGFGGTHRDTYDPVFNFNADAAAGFNFWLFRGFGIQLQTAGKFGINSDFYATDANYLQHTFSLMYRFSVEKRSESEFSHKPRYKAYRKKYKYKGRAKR